MDDLMTEMVAFCRARLGEDEASAENWHAIDCTVHWQGPARRRHRL
jgi:hypothetical protein